MKHTKTTLKCKCCGRNIYSDEAFVVFRKTQYKHYPKCDRPYKPHQCKTYEPMPAGKTGVHIPSMEIGAKLRSGFSYARN